MVVLVTCKNEEDPIKNVGARVFITLYPGIIHQCFRRARQITLELVVVSGQNTDSSMHVLVTCKNEDDRLKNEGARVFTRFLPL